MKFKFVEWLADHELFFDYTSYFLLPLIIYFAFGFNTGIIYFLTTFLLQISRIGNFLRDISIHLNYRNS